MPTTTEYLVRLNKYRDVAEELRVVSSGMHDARCRDTLLRLADSYDSMIHSIENALGHDELSTELQ